FLGRGSEDADVTERIGKLRQVRSQLARLIMATPSAGQQLTYQREIEDHLRKEQELARGLVPGGGAALGSAGWGGLEEGRRPLPAESVLVDVARFDVLDYRAAPGKQRRPARYVAWVTAAKGDVKIIDLGEAARIDAAVKAVRQALEEAPKRIRARGEAEAEM